MNSDLLLAYEAISRLSYQRQPERRPGATFEARSRRTRRRLVPILRAILATRVSRKGSER
jgi:hypothetical protein